MLRGRLPFLWPLPPPTPTPTPPVTPLHSTCFTPLLVSQSCVLRVRYDCPLCWLPRPKCDWATRLVSTLPWHTRLFIPHPTAWPSHTNQKDRVSGDWVTNFVGRGDIGQENDRGCTLSLHRKNVTECLGRPRALVLDERGVVWSGRCQL